VRKKTLTGKKESDLRTAPHFIIFILRPAKQLPKRGEINFISLPAGAAEEKKSHATILLLCGSIKFGEECK
jgi:hypothetical protein